MTSSTAVRPRSPSRRGNRHRGSVLRELPLDVVALLARQHGAATAEQLHAAGMTYRRCALAVERGLLLRPHRGVYVDRAAWRWASDVTRNAMRLYAVQLVTPDAIGIDATAAMAWQLPVRRPPDRPEVRRCGDRGRLAGAVVRRSGLRAEPAVEIEGLWVTSIPVTCVDIAGTAALPDALITLDAALRRGVAVDELLDAAARLPHTTLRQRAQRAIGFADPWSESWLESLSRGQAIDAGVAPPLCNVTLIADGREARVDELWAQQCVVGEADGKGKYRLRPDVAEAHWHEKQRHEWLEDIGFGVARWGTREAGDGGMARRLERAFSRQARLGVRWPAGVQAELRALPGVTPPARVTTQVARLQALGIPICVAPPDLWRSPERPGSLWTPSPRPLD